MLLTVQDSDVSVFVYVYKMLACVSKHGVGKAAEGAKLESA